MFLFPTFANLRIEFQRTESGRSLLQEGIVAVATAATGRNWLTGLDQGCEGVHVDDQDDYND